MSRTDAEQLTSAREHLRRLRLHLKRHDLADDTVLDAACLRLAAAIESVAAVRQDFRERVFGDGWVAIWSVRDRIVQGYNYVDRAILEDTIKHDLDEFEKSIKRLADLVTP